MLISANLGFLFTDLPLEARLEAAAAAGFAAVEFHDQPQQVGEAQLARRLSGLGLAVISLNTRMGPEMGAAALPGQGARFRAEFEAAHEAAQVLGARAIHVVAGRATGPEARASYLQNLDWALQRTAVDLLLEPLSPAATPGYHLATLEDFAAVAAALAHPRLGLMADWFHLRALYGAGALAALRPHLAHLRHGQVARPGDRGDPDPGGMPDFADFIALLEAAGVGSLGLEYHPRQPVAATRAAFAGWLSARARRGQ